MPTYDYRIIETGEVFQISQGIKEDALIEYTIPETGKTVKVERLISGGTGLIFKGDGWTPPGNLNSNSVKIPKEAKLDGQGYLNKGCDGKIKRTD